MAFSSYQNQSFGNLTVNNRITIDGCSPMLTLTLTESNTFTESLHSDAILIFTLSLIYSLSITQIICNIQTNSFSYSIFST